MKNEKLLKDMQAIVTGLSGNSIAHAFQAKIFNAQGFTKLAEKYEEHATEERDFVEKYVDRIMDLGGKIVLEDIKGQPLYTDIIDYLKSEEKISVDGIALVEQMMKDNEMDVVTYDLFKEYVADEYEDLYWTQQQLDLIDMIGKENYLTKQL